MECKELSVKIAVIDEQIESDTLEAQQLKEEDKRLEEAHRKAMAALAEQRSRTANELEQVPPPCVTVDACAHCQLHVSSPRNRWPRFARDRCCCSSPTAPR